MIFFDYNALSKANFRKAVTSRMPEVREAKLRAKMSTRVLLNFRHLSSAKTFPSRPVRQCGRKFPRKLLLSVPVTDDSRKTCVFRKLIFHPLSPCASGLSKNCYRMFFLLKLHIYSTDPGKTHGSVICCGWSLTSFYILHRVTKLKFKKSFWTD